MRLAMYSSSIISPFILFVLHTVDLVLDTMILISTSLLSIVDHSPASTIPNLSAEQICFLGSLNGFIVFQEYLRGCLFKYRVHSQTQAVWGFDCASFPLNSQQLNETQLVHLHVSATIHTNVASSNQTPRQSQHVATRARRHRCDSSRLHLPYKRF